MMWTSASGNLFVLICVVVQFLHSLWLRYVGIFGGCLYRLVKFVLTPWVAVAEAAHVADWKKIYCRCWCTARALVLCFLSTTDLSFSTRLVYSTNKNQEVPLSSVADEYFVSYTSWNFSVSYGRSTFLQNM